MMLRDPRSEHRISAMWALRQIGWWQLLGEVGRLARSDADLRVRRYALSVLRSIADLAQAGQGREDRPADDRQCRIPEGGAGITTACSMPAA